MGGGGGGGGGDWHSSTYWKVLLLQHLGIGIQVNVKGRVRTSFKILGGGREIEFIKYIKSWIFRKWSYYLLFSSPASYISRG